jgi:hypothetical protein
MTMQGAGYYEISGLPGPVWARAARRYLGRWWQDLGGGGPVRAGAAESDDAFPSAMDVERSARDADEPHHGRKGQVQKTHAEWAAQYAPRQNFHFSAIQSWAVDASAR